MTMTIVAAAMLGWTSVPPKKVGLMGIGFIVAVEAPSLAPVVVLGGLLVGAVARFRAAQRKRIADADDLAALCDLTAIGLTGGLEIRSAIELGVAHVHGDLSEEIRSVLLRARVDGMEIAMLDSGGIGQRLYGVVAQSVASGAPLLNAVGQLAGDIQAELAAAQLQTVRRLPVAMLFPLTLLILPGFLMLTVAPAILESFARLEI